MTIEEAIEHAEKRVCGNDRCAKDHAQLADWLRELRRARMEIDLLKTLRDGFKADAQMYMAENASLRGAVQGLGELCDKYKTENAEMHKVCTDAYKAICKMYAYIDGEWNYGDAGADPTYGPILRRMRELGIEEE